ncbi:hypothetical protein Q4574_11095 [Aliiglaciecola sp. 3_MG-2023]|uniref:hypothetical protein n=1 Tax=Aliiglaciecola sp. 3_MG-2023 TaxID=3062644 RepID=UPI0026E29C92|nr:hypothetical protein [Aliiglaciecola sp. 3_MG-2023]MDO6693835.1 hypothetical protein [Aliiglaciecola sp. 3_MG-2023]
MNKIKVIASIIVLIVSFALIMHDIVTIGFHVFLGAFIFFFYAMITFEDPPKIREVKPVPYISPAMFYENLRKEKRRQCLENVAVRKQRRFKASRSDGYSSSQMFQDMTTVTASSILFAGDDLILSDMASSFEETTVNPATGEFMIGGIGGVDTSGNPYGTDLHDSSSDNHIDDIGFDSISDTFDDNNLWDDSSFSSFDDDW